MINNLKIYEFAKKHKYKLIVGAATGIVIVTITSVAFSSCNDDIKYTDYGITRKTVKTIQTEEFTTKQTIPTTTVNNNYYNYYEDYEVATTAKQTTVETTKETTEPQESTSVVINKKPTTKVENEETKYKQPENITTEPRENNSNSNGYYIDQDGNYWNSYEEYKEYNDVLTDGKVYTYR